MTNKELAFASKIEYEIYKETIKPMQNKIKSLEQENQKLKKQLENVIIPKFKIGQKVYYIDCDYAKGTNDYEFKVICTKIINFSDLRYETDLPLIKKNKKTFRTSFCNENELFETEEEAEAKLKEIK